MSDDKFRWTPAVYVALEKGDVDNAIVAGTPGGIEAQEARGQQQFVAEETLPIKCDNATKEQLEALGIKIGKPVDDLFVQAQLPEGWRKEPTDHSMWSHLLDDRGRVRAKIFYKAAFYDRSAHMGLCRRFSYSVQPVGGWAIEPVSDDRIGVVTDCDKIIWQTETITRGQTPDKDYWAKEDALGDLARIWLEEQHADWQDPFAYWD